MSEKVIVIFEAEIREVKMRKLITADQEFTVRLNTTEDILELGKIAEGVEVTVREK